MRSHIKMDANVKTSGSFSCFSETFTSFHIIGDAQAIRW